MIMGTVVYLLIGCLVAAWQWPITMASGTAWQKFIHVVAWPIMFVLHIILER